MMGSVPAGVGVAGFALDGDALGALAAVGLGLGACGGRTAPG
jgi:hypothetical protein